MPNHCDTDLYIRGPREIVLMVIHKHFKDGALNCDSIIPYPDEYKTLDDAARAWDEKYGGWSNTDDEIIPPRPTDGFNSGGYLWCRDNWGTKWGTYDGDGPHLEDMRGNKLKATTRFLSAWAPPLPVFQELASMYKDLDIRSHSYEGGMGFKVIGRWKNGSLVSLLESNYRGRRGG